MSSKRGRKCSIKTCSNFQHTHKHLSFFRFPKDVERCRSWIENTKRFDLLDKSNVHDERICQQHFEQTMFLNESHNRLQQYAIPTLYLTTQPPPVQSPPDHLASNGLAGSDAFSNGKLSMSMVDAAAALLYQNNLTITPVYSSKPKQIPNVSSSEPLNLSSSSLNGNHSINNLSISNVSDSSNGSPNSSIQLPTSTTLVNGSHQLQHFNTNATQAGGFRRPRQVFSMEQEFELAAYVRETSNYYSGLSSKEVRILAFVYGVCNQVDMPNGWRENHEASFDWCVGFIKRTKLPPTMITGISMKTNKQSKTIASVEHKPNGITPQVNGIVVKTNVNTVDTTPIEID